MLRDPLRRVLGFENPARVAESLQALGEMLAELIQLPPGHVVDILIEMPQLIVHFNIHNMFRQLVHVSATSVLGCVLDASEQAASPRSNLAMILFQ